MEVLDKHPFRQGTGRMETPLVAVVEERRGGERQCVETAPLGSSAVKSSREMRPELKGTGCGGGEQGG